METPYEFFNDKLGVKCKYLITDADRHEDSLCLISYDALYKRMRRKGSSERRLRKGSWIYDSLVEFDSLCPNWRQLIHATFGKPVEEIKRSFFAKKFITDGKAKEFFETYRYGEDNLQKLKPDVIELYINNASALNTVLHIRTYRKNYSRTIGNVKLDLWGSLSKDVNEFNEVLIDLPTTPDSLRHKATRYQREGYSSIVSRKYGMRNASKVETKEQNALVEELISKHQNLNDQQIADIYNLAAKSIGWKPITARTVGNIRKKTNLFTYAGRRGETNFMHNMEMQVKRKKPSRPMIYWTADGWDVELLYKAFVLGKKSVKGGSIKNEPFIYVGNDQMLYFKVFMCDSFSKVVKHQFMKSFSIQRFSGHHFTFVGRLFGFQNYAN